MGPQFKKMGDIKELSPHPQDSNILSQGSYFDDRVFLSKKSERKLMTNLVLGTITSEEFLIGDIESENGKLILNLVERINSQYKEVPTEYLNLISELSKATSVSGYLQVTCSEALDLLESFSKGNIDLLSVNERNKLQFLQKEVPAFWRVLHSILLLENTKFMPTDVKNIVSRLVEMRKEIFENSAERRNDDYFAWENPEVEHPTQCYPLWPLKFFPKNYNVRKSTPARKEEICHKKKNRENDFANGVFRQVFI